MYTPTHWQYITHHHHHYHHHPRMLVIRLNAKISGIVLGHGDAVTLLRRHQTCDLQVVGSSPGWARLRSGLGQATGMHVCLCHQAV